MRLRTSLAALLLALLAAAPAGAATTYTWNVASGAWTTPASWLPARNTPANDDILVFNGSVTGTASVSGVPRQTIGQLHLVNAVTVTFTSGIAVPRTGTISKLGVTVGGTGTLFTTELELGDILFGNTSLSPHEVTTITNNATCLVTNTGNFTSQAWSISPRLMPSGGPGDDFTVGPGSTLRFATSSVPSISIVLQSGATAAISGSIVLQSSIHRLLALDPGAFHFKSGGSLEVGTSFIGSAFTATGTADVMVFESGSTYIHRGGANPFGLLAPASKVVYESGSLFRQLTSGGLSLMGRTYGDLDITFGTLSVVVITSGTPATVDNLSVQFGGLNFIPSIGTTSVKVRKNITVGPNGFLEFSPVGSGVAVLEMGGTSPQTVTSGGVFTLEQGSNWVVSNPSGVDLGSTIPVQGTVSLTGGNMRTSPSAMLRLLDPATLTGPGWVDGPLARDLPAGGGPVTQGFRVGDATRVAPVSVTITGPVGGDLIVSTEGGDPFAFLGLPGSGTGLQTARKVSRTWDVQSTNPGFSSASAVFQFDPADLDAGTTAANLVVGKLDGVTLTLPAVGARTSTSVEATGMTSLSDFFLAEPCGVITLNPSALPNANLGLPYSQSLLGTGGVTPYGSFAVTVGALPPGLSLSPAGLLSGTATSIGTFAFTVGATDASGCTGGGAYSVDVVGTDYVLAEPVPGSCISTATPCVSVPVVFHRTNATPVRGYSVRVELSPNLSLCGAQATSAGYLVTGTGPPLLLVTSLGSNRYAIDEATLGVPCGATGSAAMFNLLVSSMAPGGTGTITVLSVTARDCSNGPVPGFAAGSTSIAIDNTAPATVAMAAAQTLAGNVQPPNGTTDIVVNWTGQEGGSTVAVYRKGFGGYPQYDENGGAAPVAPATPAAALSAGWTLTSVTAPGAIDRTTLRDFYYYVAFAIDGCGNASAVSNRTGGTLNYHLGDVSDGVEPCAGDNLVTTVDLSLLGSGYGATLPVNHPLECIDVGPTSDLSPNGRPTTDNLIDFEDLILYSIHYEQVSAPSVVDEGSSLPAGSGREDAVLVELEPGGPGAAPGPPLRARIVLEGSGRIQGLSTRLSWDAAVVRPIAVEPGADVTAAGGIALSPGAGALDAALLGVREHGFTGRVGLGTVTFEVLSDGDPGIKLASVRARDRNNEVVAIGGEFASDPDPITDAPPSATAFLPVSPNPSRGATSFGFALARASRVELVIYSVDGRRVRTVVRGDREAGVHHVAWDGRDDESRAVPAGVYYAAFVTGEGRMTRSFLMVR